jgi:hypothetical protein
MPKGPSNIALRSLREEPNRGFLGDGSTLTQAEWDVSDLLFIRLFGLEN